jgi:hypothetical protein
MATPECRQLANGNGRRTTDNGQLTTGHGPRTTDYGQRTTDNGLLTTDHGQRTTDNGLLTTAHQAGGPHREWNEYYIGPLEIFLLKYFFAGIHSL